MGRRNLLKQNGDRNVILRGACAPPLCVRCHESNGPILVISESAGRVGVNSRALLELILAPIASCNFATGCQVAVARRTLEQVPVKHNTLSLRIERSQSPLAAQASMKFSEKLPNSLTAVTQEVLAFRG